MAEQQDSYGAIDISPAVVATIANQAINQCYGVVGMASKSMANGIAHLLARDGRRGIEIDLDENSVTIDVYVIVQYGVRIRAVAESIQNTVKFHVEKALGLPVEAVNVYIQGLRFNGEEEHE